MAEFPTLLLSTFLFIFSLQLRPSSARTSYNVLRFGAKPNGVTDSTRAFTKAWAAACGSTGSAMIYVPKGRYMVHPMDFRGQCKSSDIIIRIDGTFVAPTDYRVLGKGEHWFSFNEVSGVSIIGGRFDAKGTSLWACKASSSSCPEGATTLRFTNSNNIKIKGILSLNSQIFHVSINHCENVHIEGVQIIAHGESPNTDGIHVQSSRNVLIKNASIKTGDDCISIGPGMKNLWIERVACGPGHGISIGSLAKDEDEEGVQNVTIKTTVLTGTTNGLRIKSWGRNSNGFLQGVRFSNAIMRNVRFPIIIDQNYCPHDLNCPGQESGVNINDVIYENIRGTSSSEVAIKLDCSSKYPCRGIRMQDVHLKHGTQVAKSECANVVGKAYGVVLPRVGCL